MWKQYVRNTLWFVGGALISGLFTATALSLAIAPYIQACDKAMGLASPWNLH